MAVTVVFRRAARRELDEAALWYEERRFGLGAEFTSEINRSVTNAASNPQRFPIIEIRDALEYAASRTLYSSVPRPSVSSYWQYFTPVAIQPYGNSAHNYRLKPTPEIAPRFSRLPWRARLAVVVIAPRETWGILRGERNSSASCTRSASRRAGTGPAVIRSPMLRPQRCAVL